MLSPSLRLLLRDAAWMETTVAHASEGEEGGEGSCLHADGKAPPESQLRGESSGGGRGKRKTGRDEEEREERERLTARAFSGRRSLGLFERMDLVAAAVDDTVVGGERQHSGALRRRASAHTDPTDSSPPLSSVPVASVKLACHLSEGVAVLVSDGFLGLWLGVLSIQNLRDVLRVTAPAVALPIQEVLARLERCTLVPRTGNSGDEGGKDKDGDEEDVGSMTILVRSASDMAAFSMRGGTEVPRGTTYPETVCVRLSSPVTVLRGYKLPFAVPITCTCLRSADAEPEKPNAHDQQIPLSREAVFREMVMEPQQAQLVALGEALLLLCSESGRSPGSVASRMTAVYQQRYQNAVLAAQMGQASDHATTENAQAASSNQSAAMAVWQTQRSVAEALIHGLQMPVALQGFHGFAAELLRFAKGDGNRLVESHAGTVGDGCGAARNAEAATSSTATAATTAPEARVSPATRGADRRKQVPAPGGHANTSETSLARSASSAVPLGQERQHQWIDDQAVAAAPLLSTSQPEMPSPPPPPVSTSTAASDLEGERKKRIRTLFS